MNKKKSEDVILEISQHCHVVKIVEDPGFEDYEEDIWPYVHSRFNLTILWEEFTGERSSFRDYLAKKIDEQIHKDAMELFEEGYDPEDITIEFTEDNRKLFNQKLFKMNREEWIIEQLSKKNL